MFGLVYALVMLYLTLFLVLVHAISLDIVNLPLSCNTENGIIHWMLTITHFEVAKWEDKVVSQLQPCLEITEEIRNSVIDRVARELHQLQYIGEVPIYDTDANSHYFPLFDDVAISEEVSTTYADRYRWRVAMGELTKLPFDSNIASKTAVSTLFHAVMANKHAKQVRSQDITNTLAYTHPLCFNHLPSFQSNPLVDFNGLVAERRLNDRVNERRTGDGKMLFDSIFKSGAIKHDTEAVNKLWNQRKEQVEEAKAETTGKIVPWLRKTRIPEIFRNNGKRRFIVLQSRGANTGGTIALNDVYKTLVNLGYKPVDTDASAAEDARQGGAVLICHENNYESVHCSATVDHGSAKSSVTDRDVIITGEWCNAVMADFHIYPTVSTIGMGAGAADASSKHHLFRGRGLQYYLGFHHSSSSCAGHVRVTDCHYLSASLGDRVLGGYFLGCPMTAQIQRSVLDILQTEDDRNSSAPSLSSQRVKKENLILIDPDYMNEYRPHKQVQFEVPRGYKTIYLSNIPHAKIPLLLQRAKILLDLALPGPERLSSEAILSGTIPVQSNQWTGSSEIDFPLSSVAEDNSWQIHTNKVDNLNGSDITSKLQYIADHYTEELQHARHNNQYFNYILSLQRRHHNTADILFGSSNFHFVLTASSSSVTGTTRLEAEVACNLQILSLLFLFPMASVDLYVEDIVWYYRHHYSFTTLLRNSGYMRYDPMDPMELPDFYAKFRAEESYVRNYTDDRQSFVRIRSLSTLIGHLELSANSNAAAAFLLRDSSLCPPWEPLVVVLSAHTVFANPFSLLGMTATMTADSAVLLLQGRKDNRLLKLSFSEQVDDTAVDGLEIAEELPSALGAADGDSGSYYAMELVSLNLTQEFQTPSWAMVLSPYTSLRQVASRVLSRLSGLQNDMNANIDTDNGTERHALTDPPASAHLMSLCSLVRRVGVKSASTTDSKTAGPDHDDYNLLVRFVTESNPWLSYTNFLSQSTMSNQIHSERRAELTYLKAVCNAQRQ